MLAELQDLATAGAPREICGILLGRDGRVEGYRTACNVAGDPVRHFEIDPAILVAAERDQRDGRASILGYYHSHPAGTVRPSLTDARNAAPDGRLWLIVNGQEAAVWRTAKDGEIYGRFEAIGLDCSGANRQTAAE